MQTTTVYYFVSHHPSNPELTRAAGKKATIEAISRMQAEVIPGTDEEVPAESVTRDGFYQRMATGWGGLD